MFKKLLGAFALFALLTALFVSAAFAGGWAVVTLDAMPMDVVVNQPVSVAFMVRQHGQTPWVCDCVRVSAYHSTSQRVVVNAEMDQPGHYTATLNFDKAGVWQWSVASGLAPEWQPMPDLTVSNPSELEGAFAQAQSAKTVEKANPMATNPAAMLPLALGMLGLIGSAGGLAYWLRTRKA